MTARSPVATFSAQTRTPTSSDEVPMYSTRARRIAIWPTLTGWRKSMSSIAPSRTVPFATREAAMVPAWVIHCIMRPPWICPGAPACSGNTHCIVSVTVSAIDGMNTSAPGERRSGAPVPFLARRRAGAQTGAGTAVRLRIPKGRRRGPRPEVRGARRRVGRAHGRLPRRSVRRACRRSAAPARPRRDRPDARSPRPR